MSLLMKFTGYLSNHNRKRLQNIAHSRGSTMSALCSIALDKELSSENPFSFKTTLPTEELVEYAYADEATKILHFMQNITKGMDLNYLILLRHDMGISDHEIFLHAFKELLNAKMIEQIQPTNDLYTGPRNESYCLYQITGMDKENKKLTRDAKRYKRFLRDQEFYAKKDDL